MTFCLKDIQVKRGKEETVTYKQAIYATKWLAWTTLHTEVGP
jgi:hypothetical protein